MAGILALLAFALAFVFHGAGFNANAWLGWQSMALLGLVLLALHLVLGTGLPVVVRRRAPGE